MSFILNGEDLDSLQSYLREKGWIAPAETLNSARKPGEGNMNYTLRVRTNFRSFIIKQSRDYVEKYPQIPAPAHRAVIEGQFYELIQLDPVLRDYTPEISYIDYDNNIILLEDLGESSDMGLLYQKDKFFKENEIEDLTRFLSILHQKFSPLPTPDLSNRDMRALNAEHIFHFPFMEENGFDLDTVTPGLQEVAMKYKTDEALKERVKSLSDYYLKDGPSLLHGDYYPGSWLRTVDAGIKIIDPEFCFYGRAEFDIGVMVAHMHLAQQPEIVVGKIAASYDEPEYFDPILTEKLTGVEVMRRLIGLAQLPLVLTLEEKEELLERAYKWIMQ
ncbi:MAG: phosphotransferase [Bacteroidetes bacterium]|nr:phosphotransferase [Bacteroidota bacterium]